MPPVHSFVLPKLPLGSSNGTTRCLCASSGCRAALHDVHRTSGSACARCLMAQLP